MKELQKEFVMNCDKCGNHTFKQRRKTEIGDSGVALYQRIKLDGQHFAWEVFMYKTIKAGTALPGGKQVLEDYQQYPGAAQWGKSAWGPSTLSYANKQFDELVEKLKNEVGQPKRRGRKCSIKKDIVLPKGKFTMKILVAKTGLTQPALYLRLQKLVKEGIVIEVGRMKSESGRGRLMVQYKVK